MNINFRVHNEGGIFFYIFGFCLDSNSSGKETMQSELKFAHSSFTFRFYTLSLSFDNQLMWFAGSLKRNFSSEQSNYPYFFPFRKASQNLLVNKATNWISDNNSLSTLFTNLGWNKVRHNQRKRLIVGGREDIWL